ncbi:hypothetical protein AB4142_18125 [Variovorax sp. 2RAF20]
MTNKFSPLDPMAMCRVLTARVEAQMQTYGDGPGGSRKEAARQTPSLATTAHILVIKVSKIINRRYDWEKHLEGVHGRCSRIKDADSRTHCNEENTRRARRSGRALPGPGFMREATIPQQPPTPPDFA